MTGGAAEEGVDPSPGTPVELTAPAKLTLSLRVTGIRPDGYHLLESEMVTLDLADTLVVGPGDGLTIFDRLGWVGLGGAGCGERGAEPGRAGQRPRGRGTRRRAPARAVEAGTRRGCRGRAAPGRQRFHLVRGGFSRGVGSRRRAVAAPRCRTVPAGARQDHPAARVGPTGDVTRQTSRGSRSGTAL